MCVMKNFKAFLPFLATIVAFPSCDSGAPQASQDTIQEVLLTRRSIRKYKSEVPSRDTLEMIFKAGIYAPSALNKQPWEVRVVDNPELVKRFKDAIVAANPDAPGDSFRGATVLVFIANDLSNQYSEFDCGLLSENVMLSAHGLGVGSVCLGTPVRLLKAARGDAEVDALMDRLAFSNGYELFMCMGLGYPDETPAVKPRDETKVRFVE